MDSKSNYTFSLVMMIVFMVFLSEVETQIQVTMAEEIPSTIHKSDNSSYDSLSKVPDPNIVLERLQAADAALAKGFTATGTGGFCRQWTVAMGEDSCIIVRKQHSSPPTAEEIIKDNKMPVLGHITDVNTRPLVDYVVEWSITYFDPNCSAYQDKIISYRLNSDGQVERLGEHSSIDFEKPDALTYSMPYRMFVWSLGRGFSRNIENITSVNLLPNGNFKCEATVRDYESKSKRWEFVVDPKKNFLVMSAMYFRDSELYYKIDVNDTSQVGEIFLARKTNWQGPLGAKAQITCDSVELKNDMELKKSVEKELFGPYITSADVRDDTGSETVYKFKEIGETYRLAYVSLLKRNIPNIYGFCPSLKPEKVQGKHILVCFFDYEQRPSRNCIIELNKKLQELKSKDIEIAAIQTSKIDQAKLDEWIKENNIVFPVGMIKENEEQTRLNWGVQALPWLILTNKEHIVRAEGFPINELENKIGESSPAIKDDIISKMRSFDDTFMQASTIVVKTKSPVKSMMQAERGDKIEEITIVLNKNTIAVDREISYTEMPVYQKMPSVRTIDYDPNGRLIVWRHTRERSLLEPDFQGHSDELKCILVSPDGQTTEYAAGNPSFDFYRPDDMQRYSLFLYPILATGRGFSKYLSEVIEMHKTKDGLVNFSARGFSPLGVAQIWQMVVDPNANYLVRSASYKLINETFSFSTTGIKKFDGHSMAQRANIGPQITMEIQDYKPEVNKELLETTINMLRGPLPKGSKVYDWVTNPGHVTAYIAGDESQTESIRYTYNKLASKALPDLKQLIADFDPKQIDDKRVIICFFDFDQRPSRNCVLELYKKAKVLKSKDIEVIAVQASKIEQEKLNEWVKENSINFPVGIINEYEEKIRYDWGVQALPWLILADKKHNVTAEGFSINELDEKMNTIESEK